MFHFNGDNLCTMDIINGGGRQRRGRGRGRGKSKRGGRGGRKDHSEKKKEVILPELIDPNKVYITNINRSVTNELLKKFLSPFVHIVDVNIIRKHNHPHHHLFAFVQLANEEDTQKILNLDKMNRVLYGSCIHIQPAKRHFKIPGTVGFQKLVFPERKFEMEPVRPDEACIHSLIDDVLLKIFEYLPLKNLISLERVCRRWQTLVHASFRKKACLEIKQDLNFWLMKNKVLPTFPAISKVLILCGESMKELSVGEVSSLTQGKLLRVIAQLCPSLESITLSNIVEVKNWYLQEFVANCQHIKRFCINNRSSFNESNLNCLLSGLPNLEVIHLEDSDIQGKCLDKLPPTLKALNIGRCTFVQHNFISNIPERCPQLEVLKLEGICISSSMLTEISSRCPNLKELWVEVTGPEPQVDLSLFENLKILSYLSSMYSVNKLIASLPQLEELRLSGLWTESEMDLIDFSSLAHLRVLTLPWTNRVCVNCASLRTISHCAKLEKFKFKGDNDHRSALIELIRRCPLLRELDCSTVTLCAEDIAPFVEANRQRPHRLKLVIGLDLTALDQIEKLNDANYDVDMFDVHNLFSDFDAYDEFEDVLNDLYYENDGSFDSDDAHYFMDDDYYGYDRFLDPLGLFFPHNLDSDECDY